MALLKGFPPSNTISPGRHKLDEDDEQCYLHRRNVWLEKKEHEQYDRLSIKSMFGRSPGLGDTFPFKILGERLMDQMVALGFRGRQTFKYDLSADSAPWFVWFEYHVVHALSKALDWDVRLSWMQSWKWQKTDPWCQARMQEKLSDPTPMELKEWAKSKKTLGVTGAVKWTNMGHKNCIVRKEIPDL